MERGIKEKEQGTESPILTFWESFPVIRTLWEQPDNTLLGTCVHSVLQLLPSPSIWRDSTHGCASQYLLLKKKSALTSDIGCGQLRFLGPFISCLSFCILQNHKFQPLVSLSSSSTAPKAQQMAKWMSEYLGDQRSVFEVREKVNTLCICVV